MPRQSTQTAKRTRAPRRQTQDALHLLTDDHKALKKMFDEFAKIKDEENIEDRKQLLVETACAKLTIHAQLEEEMFYPAAREVLEEAGLIDEAAVEHAVARQLITELSAMQPDDPLYDAKFTVLCEYVQHHVEEEEKELFPKLRKSELDLVELAAAMQERRLELRDELGFTADDEDEEQTRARRRKLH